MAERGAQLREHIDLSPGPALVLRAIGELLTGSADTAAELAQRAATAAHQARDPEWLLYAHGLHGRAEYLRGNPVDAARWLAEASTIGHEIGYLDPAFFLLDADLAEALVVSANPDKATEVVTEARTRADHLGRPVVLLGLTRAAAQIRAARGEPRQAADDLRAALPAEHPYPLEVARAWFTLGQLERKARRRAAAATALREAHRRFTLAGCTTWRLRTERETTQLEPHNTPLTEVECRIATLVRDGATNQKIATSLHLSVKAVEANLTKIYRKTGTHNRVELAQHLDE
ncbi:helix-turn-helix transcriptional regulator [Amycolatopsis australiensis]|uniref:Regulatory protein, luxR family n=1 Tax=Amycolatopsis australiensis TaxID=546364 RepID=A0A1K1RRR6_9PSEU|nr:helix-turn-helix transcriptional regulator [Amycolatopsis australiensis]SFW74570.1 regulatory protein, luxR family [Amycolatopsis australiensis]